MSPDHSAVPQGAADVPIGRATAAHDQAQMHAADVPLEGSREATRAISATSMNLESSQVQSTQPKNDLDPLLPLQQHLSQNEVATENQAGACVTTPLASTKSPLKAGNEEQTRDSVTPPNSTVPQLPRDATTPAAPPSSNTTATTNNSMPPSLSHQNNCTISINIAASFSHQSNEGATSRTMSGGSPSTEAKMLFRRRNMANTSALTPYEADLTSRDRAKQKEAVKKFLTENIESDWDWEWPQGTTSRHAKNVEEARWKERDEWLSNANDSDDEPAMPSASSPDTPSFASFQFESPDDVGDSIKRREHERKRRRERKLREELAFNEGLRCFTARRDAWTGARQVNRQITRTSSKDMASLNNLARLDTSEEGSKTEVSDEDNPLVDTEVPVAPPLLPPTNAMRASITPAAYSTIYEKVVVQGLQPSCPMNLKDVVNSCVKGWQQDGTWAPKGVTPEPPVAKKKTRKLSVASIFGLQKHEKDTMDKKEEEEKDKETQGGIRRSLQKFLNLGHKEAAHKEHAYTNGANGANGTNGNGNGVLDKAKEGEAATAA